MRRFLAGAALGLLLSLAGCVALWAALVPSVRRDEPLKSPVPATEAAPPPLQPEAEEQPLYLLALGVDERPEDVGRSDTMLVIKVGAGQIRALSIPRDTRVELEQVGEAKVNAAYAYGGPELAKKAVSRLLGLPVESYVKVNLEGFRKMVDLLGGVPFNVERPMHYVDPYDHLAIDLEPGPQVLDGKKAEQYVRFRSDEIGDDLGRIGRQQAFLRAAARHALQPANIPRIPSLIYTAAKHLETDLSGPQQLRIARAAFRAQQSGTIIFETLPGEGAYVGEVSYFIPDQRALERLLQEWRASP